MLADLGVLECDTVQDICRWVRLGFSDVEDYVDAVVDCDHFREDSQQYRDCRNPDWRTRFMEPRHMPDTEMTRCWLDHANAGHLRRHPDETIYDGHAELFRAVEVARWHVADKDHHAWGEGRGLSGADPHPVGDHLPEGLRTHADCRELAPDDL